MTYHVVFVDQTRGFSRIGIYGQTAFSNFNYDVNSTRGRPSQNQFFLHYSHRKEFLEYLISGGESWVLYSYSPCRKNRRIARAVSYRRGRRIAVGPTGPSHLEHALSASIVQVPPRFCSDGIRLSFRQGL